MQIVVSLIYLGILVFALVDIITSDNWRVRFLPKVGWVLLVVFLPLIGSILWFFLGKERSWPQMPVATEQPEPRRALSTEEELAAIDREIAFHEKQAEIRRLEEQLRAKRGEAES